MANGNGFRVYEIPIYNMSICDEFCRSAARYAYTFVGYYLY